MMNNRFRNIQATYQKARLALNNADLTSALINIDYLFRLFGNQTEMEGVKKSDIFYLKADVYFRESSHELALENLDCAIELDTNNKDCLLMRCIILEYELRYAEAFENLKLLIALNVNVEKELKPRIHANILFQAGEFSAASQIFHSVFSSKNNTPSKNWTYFTAGQFAYYAQNYEKALSYLENYNDTANASTKTCLIGCSHFFLGDYRQAKVNFEKCLELPEALKFSEKDILGIEFANTLCFYHLGLSTEIEELLDKFNLDQLEFRWLLALCQCCIVINRPELANQIYRKLTTFEFSTLQPTEMRDFRKFESKHHFIQCRLFHQLQKTDSLKDISIHTKFKPN